MDFIEYLQIRHKLKIGEREIGENSARKYNNRLENLQRKKIYNGEKQIDKQMLLKINILYKDTSRDYPRTIKYYLEYLNHLDEMQQKS
jgi:hypothetical protein